MKYQNVYILYISEGTLS